MQAAVADTHKPNLCVRVASKQAVRCHQSIFRHLEGPGVDIDSNDFTVVACFHLRPYLSLIDFMAASGGFFFTIARLPHCHKASPMYAGIQGNTRLIVSRSRKI